MKSSAEKLSNDISLMKKKRRPKDAAQKFAIYACAILTVVILFDVPVIFLTARTTEVDKVSGLNLGADDYITKPFGVLELIARVNAVIRRRGRSARPQQAIESGGLKMDVSAHTLYVDGEKTELTYKEFEILRYFMRNPGLVLTREMLLNEIWGMSP